MAEHWTQVKELFSAAIETPPHRRRRLLLDSCNGNQELLREVEALLRAHEEAGTFLEDEIASVRDLPMEDVPSERRSAEDFSGRKLGVYRLEHIIGEGGMGTVYLAQRDDDLFEKQVAIKVIRQFQDRRRQDRFRKEREILGRLSHPNIAHLIDGGTTDEGLPYLVMEFVDGVPIDTYCEMHGLDLRARLDLFQKVFKAVQFAHQNLVVHRDIKPSNILVTAEGEPKLLDFGIAKMLEDDDSGPTAPPMTVTVGRWMTPEYASPEQVRGGLVTTATDVYSLGVVLYRILTGGSPYSTKDKAPYEIERIVCEDEPTRPSARVVLEKTTLSLNGASKVKMRRRLKGDLDNIILMALRKEPDRRYQSVDQFAEDIHRFLHEMPVRAQRDTFTYRASKFVQRHRYGVSVGVAFIVFGLTAFVAIVDQAEQVRHERDTARQLYSYMVSLFDVSDPELATDTTITAREILDAGVHNAREQLATQPEQLARVLNLLGSLYSKLGVYSSAEMLHREALGNSKNLGGIRIAEAYFGLAISQHSQGRFEQARGLYHDALALRERLLGHESEEVAECLHELSLLALDMNQLAVADSLVDEAIRIRSGVHGERHEAVALSLNMKAQVLRKVGDLAGAEDLYKLALSIQRETLGGDHLQVASTLNNLGLISWELGNLEDAEQLHRRALEIKRVKLGTRHPSVATTLANLGTLLGKMGHTSAARDLLEEALSIQHTRFGDSHVTVAQVRNNLAEIFEAEGDVETAEEYYRQALETWRSTLPPNHPDLAVGQHNLAMLLRNGDNLEESRDLYEKAVAGYRANLPKYSSQLSGALTGLAKIYVDLGQDDRAEHALRESLGIREESLPHGHWRIGTAESLLGEVLSRTGNLKEAELRLRSGLAILVTARGEDDEKTIEARERLEAFLSFRNS